MRERFGFQNWVGHDSKLWQGMIAEARARRKTDLPVRLNGWDRSPGAIDMARQNSSRAGTGRFTSFAAADISTFAPPAPRIILFNPPYGERMGEITELAPLYRTFGDVLKKRCAGSTAYIFCGNSELAKHVGLKATRRIPLWNGPIECRLLKYELY